jgi:hypothetical protein
VLSPAGSEAPRTRRVRIAFQEPWGADGGLLARDPRVRTLRRVLVGYPDVRHIVPDAISLDGAADPRVLETVAQFLRRQQWLVRTVTIE